MEGTPYLPPPLRAGSGCHRPLFWYGLEFGFGLKFGIWYEFGYGLGQGWGKEIGAPCLPEPRGRVRVSGGAPSAAKVPPPP